MSSPRLDNVLSWVAGSVLVATGVVIALDRKTQQRKPSKSAPLPPRATPAQEPLALQAARANEQGRGRRAAAPSEIPWRGWIDIAVRTVQGTQDHRLMALAAGVTFYSLVALFPAIAAGVSFYALFADAGMIAQNLSLASGIVPAESLTVVHDQIVRIAANSDRKLTFGVLLGLAIALWSANAGMKAIFDALNIVYNETEKRSFVRLTLISLLFTVCAIGAALLAIGLVVVLPLILAALGVSHFDRPIIAELRWPVMYVLMLGGLAVLYRYGPSRRPAKWSWISVGSIFAASIWLAVSSLYSWYLARFANYDATYGTLGAAVGMMMWMWLSTMVVLVAAQLNAEIEHQTAHDSTIGPSKPLGRRGAVMADTVGAAKTR